MLIVKWSPEQWENFWGSFAGSAATSGFKEMESLQTIFDLSPQATMWLTFEHVRLMLIVYTPLVTDPAKIRYVNTGFQNGSRLIKILQDNLQRNSSLWDSADDKIVHTAVTGYKVMAFSRKGEESVAHSAERKSSPGSRQSSDLFRHLLFPRSERRVAARPLSRAG